LIAILDYGSGNLRSAARAFATSGEEIVVTSDRKVALGAKGLVVPGVGAFAACMKGLIAVGGDEIVHERKSSGNATLGICVGMQILFRDGDEHSTGALHTGVDIWHESISKIAAPILPHMGWNTVEIDGATKLQRCRERVLLLCALIRCKESCRSNTGLGRVRRKGFSGG